MVNDESSTERERVIIEASILAVTLIFIMAQITGLNVPQFVASASVLSLSFVLAAIFATISMGLSGNRPKKDLRASVVQVELAFFLVGLVTLLVILMLIIAEHGSMSRLQEFVR